MNPSSQGPIVVLVNSLMRGGAQRLVIHDVNELYARGIDVRLITLEAERPRDSMMEECLLPSANRVCIPFPSFLSFTSWRNLYIVLREIRPRAIITHLWFSNTVGRICAMLARIPTRIAFEHNVYEGIRHRWQYMVDRFLANHSTYVVAVSDAVRQFLQAHDIPGVRIQTVRNAIDLKPPSHMLPRAELRQSLHLSLQELVLVCVGRLIPQKGIDILLRVFATLPEGKLIIVGDGSERSTLEEMIQDLHLGDRVQLLGTRKDIPDLLRMADIFVLPSRWEGLPMVILEAMAAGLPIVASAVDGTREVLVNEEMALLVQAESETQLRQALERMMRDQELRRTFQERVLKEIQNYSVTRHVDRLLELCA